MAQLGSCAIARCRPGGVRGGRTRRSAPGRPPWSRRRSRWRRRAARPRRDGPEPSRHAAGCVSSHAVSTSPASRSERPSSSSRNGWLVVPPSITTVVSASARRRRASASPRSLPHAMTLAIIESNSAGITSPSPTPVSIRRPGPVGRRSSSMRPGAGAKSSAGILGVQPRLDRVTARGGRRAVEAPAGGNVQLQLDQVDAGGDLGDGMLDLQPGVDLHERQAAGRAGDTGTPPCRHRGSRPAPARRTGRSAQLVVLLRRQRRRSRTPRSPSGGGAGYEQSRTPSAHTVPVAVGDDLHLDMARRADQLLEQHGRVDRRSRAPPPGRSRTRTTRASIESTRRIPRPPPPAAALIISGKADSSCACSSASLTWLDARRRSTERPARPPPRRAAWPRSCRRARRMTAGVGTDEHDVQPLAQLRELGILGDEAPSDPGRVGPRDHERALERVVIQVAAAAVALFVDDGRGPEADTPRRRRATNIAPRSGSVYRAIVRIGALARGVELAHGMDQPHRGLAAVDDRQPCERAGE